ncbi:MAG: calcium-binding protein [Microcoleus sp. PH2017_10_PVI_O_A]|uniref:calcium-binding protein n=1 Tax=unclassified Microcoleus TaxID=2642155 RepID=UPI001D3C6C41|nr:MULTISPECIES: calcium-binding protein [unclassified Microcoleus]TAE80151.1 MAG: calcium-binding protein [Oscillatoriales cyanobacterium]MCC3404598.1 calcium-binding protein [Microcoleus sp. PH2017_10_PVI_O_A]MCC3461926.1 calcium-binding protein [Microcoleus sp. PH2017_11_PCY_U_A]MCC3480311.1 calcium-binding protein [Microcoleus sp. PH2017_12_PCY_D_A]MCC3527056.1 calcium-binding protein [Microcoleus sp. PH2017_21_RUC_O_A]
MLETNVGEIKSLAIDSDPIIPDPPNIRLLTGPLPNPIDPNFFDLTPNNDTVQLANGILRNTPGGLRALAGDDFVRGSGGAELMNGNGGFDTLIGGCGNDTIRGGQDSDILYGQCGNDILSGNQGDDVAYGGTGNDFVRGGQGNDALVGDSGNDTLIGDAGIDRLWGKEGADLFVIRREAGATSREFGSAQARPIGTFPLSTEEVPADFILDYNPAQGDVIGLAGGLTRNDIVLTERFATIGDARSYDSNGPIPPGSIITTEFRFLNIKATVIREASTGNILGLVKDVSPSQLQFASVSDSAIALG